MPTRRRRSIGALHASIRHVEAPGEFLHALRDFMETTVPATLEVQQFQRILRQRAHAMN